MIGLPILDFDGTAEMWVESVEQYAAHMSQEEIVQAIMSELPGVLAQIALRKLTIFRGCSKLHGCWCPRNDRV